VVVTMAVPMVSSAAEGQAEEGEEASWGRSTGRPGGVRSGAHDGD
jgi:hypothetical protein